MSAVNEWRLYLYFISSKRFLLMWLISSNLRNKLLFLKIIIHNYVFVIILMLVWQKNILMILKPLAVPKHTSVLFGDKKKFWKILSDWVTRPLTGDQLKLSTPSLKRRIGQIGRNINLNIEIEKCFSKYHSFLFFLLSKYLKC